MRDSALAAGRLYGIRVCSSVTWLCLIHDAVDAYDYGTAPISTRRDDRGGLWREACAAAVATTARLPGARRPRRSRATPIGGASLAL